MARSSVRAKKQTKKINSPEPTSIKKLVFWLWRKAFPAAPKWKNAPVINIWKLGIAGRVTQPVELRTGDATSLGRTPDNWLLSCPKDRFPKLRAQPAGAHGTRGHLKLTSYRNLIKGKQIESRACVLILFFRDANQSRVPRRVEYEYTPKRGKLTCLPAPPPYTQFPKTQCDVISTMWVLDKLLEIFTTCSAKNIYIIRLQGGTVV